MLLCAPPEHHKQPPYCLVLLCVLVHLDAPENRKLFISSHHIAWCSFARWFPLTIGNVHKQPPYCLVLLCALVPLDPPEHRKLFISSHHILGALVYLDPPENRGTRRGLSRKRVRASGRSKVPWTIFRASERWVSWKSPPATMPAKSTSSWMSLQGSG